MATITSQPLKNNAGTVLANETDVTALVYLENGAAVVGKYSQTTNASGVLTVSDAAITAAVVHRVVIILASGAEGLFKATAV